MPCGRREQQGGHGSDILMTLVTTVAVGALIATKLPPYSSTSSSPTSESVRSRRPPPLPRAQRHALPSRQGAYYSREDDTRPRSRGFGYFHEDDEDYYYGQRLDHRDEFGRHPPVYHHYESIPRRGQRYDRRDRDYEYERHVYMETNRRRSRRAPHHEADHAASQVEGYLIYDPDDYVKESEEGFQQSPRLLTDGETAARHEALRASEYGNGADGREARQSGRWRPDGEQ